MQTELYETLTALDLNDLEDYRYDHPEIDQEDPDYMCLAAICFRDGKGVDPQYEEYLSRLHQAAELGSVRAQQLLGGMRQAETASRKNRSGEGSPDWAAYEQMTVAQLMEAVREKDPAAFCQQAQFCIRYGWFAEARTHLKEAEDLLADSPEITSAQYFGSIYYRIGEIYENLSTQDQADPEGDIRSAFKAFSSARELMYPGAYRKLAEYYEQGKACEKDLKRALEYRAVSAKEGTCRDKYDYALKLIENNRRMEAVFILDNVLHDTGADSVTLELAKDQYEQLISPRRTEEQAAEEMPEQPEEPEDDEPVPETDPEQIRSLGNYELQRLADRKNIYALIEAARRCLEKKSREEGDSYLDRADERLQEMRENGAAGSTLAKPLLLYGELLESDGRRQEAFICISEAAELGSVRAKKRKIHYLEEGIGCTPDPDAALELRQELESEDMLTSSELLELVQILVGRKLYFKAEALIEKLKSTSGTDEDVLGRIKSLQEEIGRENRDLKEKQDQGRLEELFAAIEASDSEAVDLLLGSDDGKTLVNKALRSQWDYRLPLAKAVECYARDKVPSEEKFSIVRQLVRYGADVNARDFRVYSDRSQGIRGAAFFAMSASDSGRMLDYLLNCGADVNAFRVYKKADAYSEYSLLCDSVWNYKNIDMARVLIRRGADVNRVEDNISESGVHYRKSMISYAVTNAKDTELVNLLLDHGADVNAVRLREKNGSHEEYSLLCDSIFDLKDREMARLLIERGADVNRVEDNISESGIHYRKSMIAYAVLNAKDPEMVQLLLDHGADVNAVRLREKNGSHEECSLLCDSIFDLKDREMARLLIERGADVNRVEDNISESGIHYRKSMIAYAVLDAKDPEMVQLLLNHGADINAVRLWEKKGSHQEYSLLGDSIWNVKDPELTRFLLDHGADVSFPDTVSEADGTVKEQKQLYNAVCFQKSCVSAVSLLERGAGPDTDVIVEQNGERRRISALADAVLRNGNPELVKLLLFYGADCNERSEGKIAKHDVTASPLFFALLRKDAAMIESLLCAGASVTGTVTVDGNEIPFTDIPFDRVITDEKLLEMLTARGWLHSSGTHADLIRELEGSLSPLTREEISKTAQMTSLWENGMPGTLPALLASVRDGMIRPWQLVPKESYYTGQYDYMLAPFYTGFREYTVDPIEMNLSEIKDYCRSVVMSALRDPVITIRGGCVTREDVLAYVVAKAHSTTFVNLLLETGAADLKTGGRIFWNGAKKERFSHLYLCMLENNEEAAELILKAGGDQNAPETHVVEGKPVSGPLLWFAVVRRQDSFIRLLARYGADLDAEVSIDGVKRTFRKYPLRQIPGMDRDTLRQMRECGWTGPGLFG